VPNEGGRIKIVVVDFLWQIPCSREKRRWRCHEAGTD
jgi:hypothetical protein